MGALDTLQSFVQTKVEKVVNKVTGRGSKSSATPGKGDTTHGDLLGFPFVNYATELISIRPMVTPRVKYTYGVQFNINKDALLEGVAITNLNTFLTNNYLYKQLKRIDHPKPGFVVDTLRSYNKYVKVPTKMEYPPASMSFVDDNTSITTALIKEYINFYSHAGNVGSPLAANSNNAGPTQPSNFNGSSDDAFSNDQPNVGYNHLIANAETPEPREHMDIRPSMGLRLKANYKRHFFDSIVIYDLGIDPNSVNIYYFYKPVITTIDHAPLDTDDRTSIVEVTMNFEYENYHFAIGRNRLEVADAIEALTGVRPSEEITNNFFPNSHGAMLDVPTSGSIPVSKVSPNPMTPMPDVEAPTTTTAAPQPVTPSGRPPGEIEADIEKARIELTGIAARTSSTGGDDAEAEFETMRLTNKIKLLNEELNASATAVAEVKKREQSAPATQSAVKNTIDKGTDTILTRSEELIKEIEDSDGLTEEQKKNLIAQVTEDSVQQIRGLSNTIRASNTVKNQENKFQGPPEREIPAFERNVDSTGNVRGLNKDQWAANEVKHQKMFDEASAKSDKLTELIHEKELGIIKAETSLFGSRQVEERASLEALVKKRAIQRAVAGSAGNKLGIDQAAQRQIKQWENAQRVNDPV